MTQGQGTMVSLLDGKLKLDIPSDFSRDADDPKKPKTARQIFRTRMAHGEKYCAARTGSHPTSSRVISKRA